MTTTYENLIKTAILETEFGERDDASSTPVQPFYFYNSHRVTRTRHPKVVLSCSAYEIAAMTPYELVAIHNDSRLDA